MPVLFQFVPTLRLILLKESPNSKEHHAKADEPKYDIDPEYGPPEVRIYGAIQLLL